MSVAKASHDVVRLAEGRSWRAWGWCAAAATIAVLAYGPLMWMFFRQQWQKPHYQYFPFVIGAFVWLLWRRTADATPRTTPRPGGKWLEAAALVASLALLAAAIAIRSPMAAAASLILLAGYVCLVISRTRRVTNLLGVWLILWLMAPLPFGLDQRLITKLQAISSQISSYLLDLLSVNHLMEGNALTLPGKQLFVDEACSGIISILSIVACAAIYAVYQNRTLLHLILLAAVGVFWATIVNVVRITAIAYVFDKWGIDWSAGTPHEALSLVLFLVTFLALLSSDRVLDVCLSPVAGAWHESHGDDLRYGRALAIGWDYLTSLGRPTADGWEVSAAAPVRKSASDAALAAGGRLIAGLLVIPAVLQAGLLAYAFRIAPEHLDVLPRARAIESKLLPDELAGLRKKEFKSEDRSMGDIFGRHSRTFEYDDPRTGARYVASFDFPFAGGWHELTVCYTSTGWEPVERTMHPLTNDDGTKWDLVEADFEKPGGQHGYLAFAEFDQYGDALRPYTDWLESGDSFFGTRNSYLRDRHGFQTQVWVAQDGVVSPAQREKARELLIEVRRLCREYIVKAGKSAPAERAPSP